MTTLKLRADTEQDFYLTIPEELVALLKHINSLDSDTPVDVARKFCTLVGSAIDANAEVFHSIYQADEDAGSEDYLVTYAAQDYLDYGNQQVQPA